MAAIGNKQCIQCRNLPAGAFATVVGRRGHEEDCLKCQCGYEGARDTWAAEGLAHFNACQTRRRLGYGPLTEGDGQVRPTAPAAAGAVPAGGGVAILAQPAAAAPIYVQSDDDTQRRNSIALLEQSCFLDPAGGIVLPTELVKVLKGLRPPGIKAHILEFCTNYLGGLIQADRAMLERIAEEALPVASRPDVFAYGLQGPDGQVRCTDSFPSWHSKLMPMAAAIRFGRFPEFNLAVCKLAEDWSLFKEMVISANAIRAMNALSPGSSAPSTTPHSPARPARQKKLSMGGKRCHGCGLLGHIKAHCPNNNGNSKRPSAGKKQASKPQPRRETGVLPDPKDE